jgi:F-type H+-transporting ATPase subunit b
MLIDWFTVGAQALNFLILVWLMKRFLYKPILNAIDTREKRIAKELADADAKKTEAQKERDEFQHKNEEFDQQRAALLTKATDEAKAERLRFLDEARKAADALSAKRQESLVNDAHNLNQAISRLTQKEVFSITRKALTDLATVSLEERMGEVFTRRLRELDDKAKIVLGDALKKNPEPALVRSAFDLPAEQRAAIQNALNETFSAEIHLRFETSPDLVSGIELSANGQKVGWSIADYLASLEKGVGELLKEKDKPAPKPEVKVDPKPESPKPEVKAEPKPEPASESKTEANAESKPKAESKPQPEIKPAAKSEVEAAPKPEAKDEPKPESKTEP